MSIRDKLLQLAAYKAVKDHLSQLDAADKSELMGEVGGRMGATAATLEDGTEVATVSISKGKAAQWYVADERAFLRWVKEHQPSAVVESVRPSDQQAILGAIKTTGEVPDGVEIGNAGEPYVSVRQSAEQRAALVDAWRAGQIPMPRLQLGDGS